jgi:pimeloyl-ACP methyl ester carboxylesterase
MPHELVEAAMSDGLRLHAALHAPAAGTNAATAFDAVLLVHGTGSNFYSSSLWAGLIPRMLDWGIAVLAVNTRGHDGISTARGLPDRRWQGSAYEIVDECRHDIAGWLRFLAARGYRRVALVGHSLGAVKAIYSQAAAADPLVAAIVAISPPRLSHTHFSQSPRGPAFLEEYAKAARLVDEGAGQTLLEVRFPLPYFVTAAGYVDKYGPAERYDVTRLVERIACPTLFTFGTVEVQQGMAFRGVPELLEDVRNQHQLDFDLAMIAGADHIYSGTHSELAARIKSWLAKNPTKL